MFARTARLTLRPFWPEEAGVLAAAIGHEAVARNLSPVPWPYSTANASAFLASDLEPDEAVFAITAHETGEPVLIGCIGLHRGWNAHELGYWLTPDAWGRGYATEAGHAVVAIARDSLRLRRVHSNWFIDNPASGRVLSKLGFRETGRTRVHSRARGCEVDAVTVTLDLRDQRPLPMAA